VRLFRLRWFDLVDRNAGAGELSEHFLVRNVAGRVGNAGIHQPARLLVVAGVVGLDGCRDAALQQLGADRELVAEGECPVIEAAALRPVAFSELLNCVPDEATHQPPSDGPLVAVAQQRFPTQAKRVGLGVVRSHLPGECHKEAFDE